MNTFNIHDKSKDIFGIIDICNNSIIPIKQDDFFHSNSLWIRKCARICSQMAKESEAQNLFSINQNNREWGVATFVSSP